MKMKSIFDEDEDEDKGTPRIIGYDYKKCIGCDTLKPWDHFEDNDRNEDGKCTFCISCNISKKEVCEKTIKKTCNKCKKELPITDFRKNRIYNSTDGRDITCKYCKKGDIIKKHNSKKITINNVYYPYLEAAKNLDISVKTLYTNQKKWGLTPVVFMRKVMFKKGDIDDFIINLKDRSGEVFHGDKKQLDIEYYI